MDIRSSSSDERTTEGDSFGLTVDDENVDVFIRWAAVSLISLPLASCLSDTSGLSGGTWKGHGQPVVIACLWCGALVRHCHCHPARRANINVFANTVFTCWMRKTMCTVTIC